MKTHNNSSNHHLNGISALLLSAFFLFISPAYTKGSTMAKANTAIDWQGFLARHDPIWERTPKTWMEGAFIGNGRLGAMIYRGDLEAEPRADVLAWTVNRSDLYDDREPPESEKHGSRNRTPVGRLHLCPVGELKSSHLRLDLWNGEARGRLETSKGKVKWQSWVQPGDVESGVVVLVIETDDGESETTTKWQAFRSMCPRHFARPPESGVKPNGPGKLEKVGDTEVWTQPFLVGGDYATAWKTVDLGENRRAVFLAIGDGRIGGGSAKKAVSAVESAAQKGVEALQKDNRAWWHAFYQKSFLSIPDARLESHYWIQMYKLASATREGGVVIDTCGPWLKVDTVWPKCWWNLNMQLNHYPVPVSNHLELGEPLIRLIQQEFENGTLTRNAPEKMRHDSAYFGNPTTTYNLINNDVYWKGGRKGRLYRPGARLNQLPWICHTLWEHYRRNMDDEFLRRTLFPLTKQGYNFIFHFLKEGKDGRIHIPDTFSSEYGTADDSNEAIAMVRWGTGALLWMAERLKIDDPDIPRWKDIQKRLVPPPVDETGLRIGADVRLEHGHRHYSHLMSLVPFRTWDFEGKESRKLAYRSLEWFLHFKRGLAGYSYTGASSMYAALGDGDKALGCLQKYLRNFDRPNTMYTETRPHSPVMETPLSAARCVQDMLLQSHDVIRVFPALPNSWKDASFDKLLAEGAFEVSAVRKNGQTVFVRIKSLAGEPCEVKTGLDAPTRLTSKGDVALTVDARGVTKLELAKGEVAMLVAKDGPRDQNIEPVKHPRKNWNHYGVKK